jgi:solute carrier family 25 protein 16
MKYSPHWTCNSLERNTGNKNNRKVCLRAYTHVCLLFILGGLVLIVPAKLLCGGLAGAIAQTFSYPLDVTRRRMQLAMMDPQTAKFG